MKQSSQAYQTYLEFFYEVRPNGTPIQASEFKSINELAREINRLKKEQIKTAREELNKGIADSITDAKNSFDSILANLRPQNASKLLLREHADVIRAYRLLKDTIEAARKDLQSKGKVEQPPRKSEKENAKEEEPAKQESSVDVVIPVETVQENTVREQVKSEKSVVEEKQEVEQPKQEEKPAEPQKPKQEEKPAEPQKPKQEEKPAEPQVFDFARESILQQTSLLERMQARLEKGENPKKEVKEEMFYQSQSENKTLFDRFALVFDKIKELPDMIDEKVAKFVNSTDTFIADFIGATEQEAPEVEGGEDQLTEDEIRSIIAADQEAQINPADELPEMELPEQPEEEEDKSRPIKAIPYNPEEEQRDTQVKTAEEEKPTVINLTTDMMPEDNERVEEDEEPEQPRVIEKEVIEKETIKEVESEEPEQHEFEQEFVPEGPAEEGTLETKEILPEAPENQEEQTTVEPVNQEELVEEPQAQQPAEPSKQEESIEPVESELKVNELLPEPSVEEKAEEPQALEPAEEEKAEEPVTPEPIVSEAPKQEEPEQHEFEQEFVPEGPAEEGTLETKEILPEAPEPAEEEKAEEPQAQQPEAPQPSVELENKLQEIADEVKQEEPVQATLENKLQEIADEVKQEEPVQPEQVESEEQPEQVEATMRQDIPEMEPAEVIENNTTEQEVVNNYNEQVVNNSYEVVEATPVQEQPDFILPEVVGMKQDEVDVNSKDWEEDVDAPAYEESTDLMESIDMIKDALKILSNEHLEIYQLMMEKTEEDSENDEESEEDADEEKQKTLKQALMKSLLGRSTKFATSVLTKLTGSSSMASHILPMLSSLMTNPVFLGILAAGAGWMIGKGMSNAAQQNLREQSDVLKQQWDALPQETQKHYDEVIDDINNNTPNNTGLASLYSGGIVHEGERIMEVNPELSAEFIKKAAESGGGFNFLQRYLGANGTLTAEAQQKMNEDFIKMNARVVLVEGRNSHGEKYKAYRLAHYGMDTNDVTVRDDQRKTMMAYYNNQEDYRQFKEAHPDYDPTSTGAWVADGAKMFFQYGGGLASKVPVIGDALAVPWKAQADLVDRLAPTPTGYAGALLVDNKLDAAGDPRRWRSDQQRRQDYNDMLDAIGSGAPRRATGDIFYDTQHGLTIGESLRGKSDWELEEEKAREANGWGGTSPFGPANNGMTIINNTYFGAGFNQVPNGGDTPR